MMQVNGTGSTAATAAAATARPSGSRVSAFASRAAQPLRAAAARPVRMSPAGMQQRIQVKATATAPSTAPLHSIPPPAVQQPAPVPATLPPPKIVEVALNAAVAKSQYSWEKTFLLSFAAGAQIALGALLMTIVAGGSSSLAATTPGLHKFLAGAIGLPTGLSLVVLTGAELVTGNFFVMTTGWLAKRVSAAALLKNWAVSFVGNLVGALFIAVLAHLARTTTAAPWLGASIGIATAKVSFPFVAAFVKGALCNWLVCSAVWMAMASQSTAGKVLGVWLPVSMFVALGFEHSVANMFLIPQGMLNGAPVSVGQFLLGNLLPVTLGNIFGGAVLMGCLNFYAHHAAAPAQR